MKHLKFFKNSKIHRLCKKFNLGNYTINPDGYVDVEDNVDLRGFGLTEIPLKFRNVSGHFYCGSSVLFLHNRLLTSLEGAPVNIRGGISL